MYGAAPACEVHATSTAGSMSQQNEPLASTPTDVHNAPTLPDVPGSAAPSVLGGGAHLASPLRKYNFFLDLLRGIFLGAYAVDELHMPGLFVWIILGFVPVVGTVCALRDAYYSVEVHEWGGLVFNLVGLLPFMKGFANIVEVSHLRRLKHLAHATHQVMHVARQESKIRKARNLSKIRKVRPGSGKLASVVTGAAHDAGAVSIMLAPQQLTGRNTAAWPALLLGFFSAFVLPVVMLIILDVLAGGAYFSYSIPLGYALGSGIFALVVSAAILLLAGRARRLAKLLHGRAFSRGFVSSIAMGLAWLGVLASVLVMLTILYIERASLPTL